MTPITAYLLELPDDIADEHGARAKWVRERLSQALAAEVTPRSLPKVGLQRLSVAIPGKLLVPLEALAAEHEVAPGRMIGMLLAAEAQCEDVGADAPADDPALAQLRPEQGTLYRNARDALDRRAIGLCEGATGIGKSRIIAMLARRALENDQGPVVISAPLATLRSHIKEVEAVSDLRCRVLLGRRNFVDPLVLAELLTEYPEPAVQHWMEEGGAPHTAETRKLAHHVAGIRWLMDDLVALASDEFPVDDAALGANADDGNPGEQAYRAVRDGAIASPLVLCSHHMLAQDVMLRRRAEKSESESGWMLAERFGTLLVDEAHLLEQAFAAIFSHSMHLSAFLSSLRSDQRHLAGKQRTACAIAIDHVEDLIEALRRLPSETTVLGKAVHGQHHNTIERAWGIATDLKASLTTLSRSQAKGKGRRLATDCDNAIGLLTNLLSRNYRVQIGFSPVRRQPSLAVGHASLIWALQLLWERADRAGLFSATLYLPTREGPSASYMRWILGIPNERVAYMPPAIPAWVVDSATLHMASGDQARFLPPEQEAGGSDEERWHDAIAESVRAIHQRARGGVLMLCTSYRTALSVGTRLADLNDQVIVQTPARPTAACRNRMIALHREGQKPMWIAVGSAWTGVDLTDETVPAAEDNLLTDLYIPRVPFGLNRSVTHAARRERIGFQAELSEAMRMLLQGLGRLIRRPGLSDRHIWVSDIRLRLPKYRYLAACNEVLARYRQESFLE